MKQRFRIAGTLLSLVAAAVFPLGCSGGGNGGLGTALEGDVLPEGIPVSAELTLNATQQAIVLLQREGSSVSGALEVGAPPAALKAQAATLVIPSQRYTFSGSLSGQRHFEVNGRFPGSLGAFKLTGDLPTTRRGGVMVATTDLDGDGVPEVVTGTPPSFPVLSRSGATANVQITNPSSGFNGVTTTITQAQGLLSTANTRMTAYLATASSQNSPRRFLRIAIVNNTPVAAGQSYDTNNTGQAVAVIAYAEIIPRSGNTGPIIRRWFSTQGIVNIQSLNSQTVTLQLNNLAMQADGTAGSQAIGTFTLDGNFTVHGSAGGVYVG